MIQENLIKMYGQSFRDNWELKCVSDYGTGTTFYFSDVAEEIAKLHLLFDHFQIKSGDKIALVGKDCARWSIAYMSVITYGAVIVPILQDFNPNDIHHIINHSESSFLFVSVRMWDAIDTDSFEYIKGVVSLTDLSLLHSFINKETGTIKNSVSESFTKKYPDGFTKEDVDYKDISNESLIEINYTSGTTGFSKGVMLTANNLAGNVVYAKTLDLMFRGDEELCFLPLAHAYSCGFNLLAPMAIGAHVHILGKMPTPKILLDAFSAVKPNLIITVPLILEKIYKKTILPKLDQQMMKIALSIPFLANRIYDRINKKLSESLGGNFCEVIVGGAAMNQDVTDFLCRIKFPVTIGYGMTETAPLISYSNHNHFEPTSCGHILKRIMDVRIDSSDPYNEVGEIQVKGENVMLGYYKNEEATNKAFTDDGWFRTGDLGTIDKEKRIYIRGRNKTMILSSNGQNIYPEELESKLNNFPFVMESLVIERNGKLIGLVYPDYEQADNMKMTHEELDLFMEHNRKEVNKLLAPFEYISKIELYPSGFEKTPKNSIKRYLYTKY
ncbi:MAG: AMP-binding protein [Tannerella sp.]|jgi:long-chain acyl-CoA synthetase|nr:AMP-binding protein [Tannerella sp.]